MKIQLIIVLILLFIVVNCSQNIGLKTCIMANTALNDKLRITAWNSRGLRAAQPYLEKITSMSDIVVISEHDLYESQVYRLNDINRDFISYSKCAENLDPNLMGIVPGHGGVAILWNKTISCKVKPLRDLGTDRICAVELFTDRGSMYIIGVYLPHAGCTNANYQQHLDALEYMIEEVGHGGEVVVIGDFNAHFGTEERFPRGWGRTSPNGKRLRDMAKRCGMTLVDMTSLCKGPNHTFENERGHMSYVDHCMVSGRPVCNVKSCDVLDDVLNTSDHLAITCMIDIQGILMRDMGNIPIPNPKVAWHKMSKSDIEQNYSTVVDSKLMVSPLMTNREQIGDVPTSREFIENCVNSFENVVKDVCKGLPVTKYNKHLKPYWNTGLNESVTTKKQAWRAWLNAGRPRENHPAWLEYKEAKRLFRRDQRRASLAHETSYLDEVSKTQEIDQRAFWKLINKRRNPRNRHTNPVVNKEGNTIRDPDGIVRVWENYYGDLYTPSDAEHYDGEFREIVDQAISQEDMTPRNDSTTLKSPITPEEVKETCESLKVGKASGLDGIQPEHLKYAGPITCMYLSKLFNAMTAAEWRPESMRKGVIVPIPKGNKDQTIPDNNRGITLRSVLGKLYDKILLKRSDHWFQSIMHDQQGANRTSCSSVNTAMLLKETISYNVNKGNSVYTALLDTKKAFDTVWQNGLFFKLKQYGVDNKLWRILRNVYNDFQCAVNIGGKLSGWFHPQQGVHQGDVFSMKLYGVFNDSLINELTESGYGTKICSIRCGNPTFADDIAIASTSKMALNRQLDIAHRYSCKWRFSFNVKKTQGAIFGEDKSPDIVTKLGREVVQVTAQGNHLGTPLYSNQKTHDVVINEKITVCRKCFYALEGIGSGGRGFDPATFSKLYLTVCLPRMLYGIETFNISEKGLDLLESEHNACGRKIQRLPALSARPANYALLGWRSIRAYVDIQRLIFLFGILSLPCNALSWKILVKRWTECRFIDDASNILRGACSSPVAMLYATARRHGLDNNI